MKLSNVLLVYGKELRDLLRDRRTVLSMFIIPSLVMPALMFGFGFLAKKVVGKAQEEVPSISVKGEENAPALVSALHAWGHFDFRSSSEDLEKKVGDKVLKAALVIPPGFDDRLKAGENLKLTIFTYEGDLKSGLAASELERFLADYRDKLVKSRLAERGLTDTFIKPYGFERQNVASPEKVGGSTIGGLIPYLFILLCYTGAMYPALDLTAGEKERGTLETILCSPLSRLELVLGKFLMVLTASLSTVVSALGSLALWLFLLGNFLMGGDVAAGQAGAGTAPHLSLSVPGLVGVIFLVLPLAVLFSAVLLGLGLFAKTMKEAQSYAGPMTIVIVLPGMAALLPGVELTSKLALVPILNVALVSKEMVAGNFPWGLIALIFASTALYSGLALAWAVRQFNREDVVFRT